MIDKDKAERAAVQNNDLRPILCDFHLHQTLDPRVNTVFSEEVEKEFWRLFLQCQRCKTWPDLSAAIEVLSNWFKNSEEEVLKPGGMTTLSLLCVGSRLAHYNWGRS